MKLTTPQERSYKSLKKSLKRIESSESKWGIAFIGPNGYGKTTVIEKIEDLNLTEENLKFVYLNLSIPAICPQKTHVHWDEYIQRVKELLPSADFTEIENIKSFSGKMEKIASICKENGKRIFIVLDHLEECKDWREARWPIENHLTDVIVVCNNDVWEERESDRVVTSFFFKRIYLDMPLDYEKDEEKFFEIISDRFEIDEKRIHELYEKCKKITLEGKILNWYEVFREADEMEKINE